ncbi:hypothetical protein [Metasolibacillus sp. FSL K6-0083]|uniref:hypothetical protein n=1 Tax=Metasolibacillus sp. FSL K6-0083 TaxID=2921416 RepID=UPI00315AFFF7
MDVKNFFLKKDVFDLEDLVSNPSSYIGGFNNQFLVDIVGANKKKYIEGGILSIEGSLTFTMWNKEIGGIPLFDDLASLYAYYLNAIEEFMAEGVARFYYPSQPIEVCLEEGKNGNTKISIDNQNLNMNTNQLLNLILASAASFFELLVKELNLDKYEYEVKQIEHIKELIKT